MTEPHLTITAYPDGPLIVRGALELRTIGGEPIRVTRRTVALCRCGLSTIKPFCDGTHKISGFRTDDAGTDDAGTDETGTDETGTDETGVHGRSSP